MHNTIRVGERELRVAKFATREGLRVLSQLVALAAPAVALSVKDGGDIDVITKLVESVKPADLDWLIDTFADKTECQVTDGGGFVKLSIPSVFDTVFAADYAAVIEWLQFCLTLNYSDFLASIGVRAAGLPKVK